MIDKLTEQRIALLHPKIRKDVFRMYREEVAPALTNGVYCRFTHTLRTFQEQDELYKIGREKFFDADGSRLGIVTRAKGGQSFHNFSLAIDFCIMASRTATWDILVDLDKDGKADWMEVVNIFKRNKFEWGGDWKKFRDFPHLQKTFGYTTKELLEKWNKGDTFIDNGVKYVNL
jgi:peptidoglycan L-alanyl-D-glutamate endopeptidase CwlK